MSSTVHAHERSDNPASFQECVDRRDEGCNHRIIHGRSPWDRILSEAHNAGTEHFGFSNEKRGGGGAVHVV